MSSIFSKRVLFFNDGLQLGGTEKLLVNLLNYLVNKGCTVTLLLPEESSDNVLLKEVSDKVRVSYLYDTRELSLSKKWGQIKMIFNTKSFLNQKKILEKDYDVVVCFKEGFYAKMFADFEIKTVLWIHNILYVRKYEVSSVKEGLAVWLNKKEVLATQRSYTKYDEVICVSEACKQSYLSVIYGGGMSTQNISVIPNALDLSKIEKLSKEGSNRKLLTSGTNFVLLTRLSPDKRVDRIIKVATRLKDEGYSDFIIHVLGIDTDSEQLKKEVEKQNLQNTILLYGRIENPYPMLANADWLLCVSERESFSLSILEAMSLGVPVITTDCGGPAGIVKDGKYGVLVENSTAGVYQGMKSVLDDKDLSKRYSGLLKDALKSYDYESWLSVTENIILS